MRSVTYLSKLFLVLPLKYNAQVYLNKSPNQEPSHHLRRFCNIGCILSTFYHLNRVIRSTQTIDVSAVILHRTSFHKGPLSTLHGFNYGWGRVYSYAPSEACHQTLNSFSAGITVSVTWGYRTVVFIIQLYNGAVQE